MRLGDSRPQLLFVEHWLPRGDLRDASACAAERSVTRYENGLALNPISTVGEVSVSVLVAAVTGTEP
jgi:hypothetical protein